MVCLLNHLLSRLQVAGLILENTFTSILDMAGVMLPVLRYIVGGKGGLLNWFVKSPWKTIELIKHVSSSVLSISLDAGLSFYLVLSSLSSILGTTWTCIVKNRVVISPPGMEGP